MARDNETVPAAVIENARAAIGENFFAEVTEDPAVNLVAKGLNDRAIEAILWLCW